MLDSDLAEIYGYEVKALNRQVKRNAERFPEDFKFTLTNDELVDFSRCQFGTMKNRDGREKTLNTNHMLSPNKASIC